MISFQCFTCKRFRPGNTCKAFPDGIPSEIRLGKFDHNKKHPDQKNDIVFSRGEWEILDIVDSKDA